MMIDKAFCKYKDGSFGRNIAHREGKLISRVSVYSSKNKMLPFPWQKWSNVTNLSPGSWLITLANSVISDSVFVCAAGS